MTVRRALRIFQLRARSLSQKRDLDMELSDEMAFHFDQLVEENIADGMSPGEAEVAARRVLGNVALLEEQCRDHRRVGWLHDLWQDVRYGMRMLRKSPGFTAIVATSLALGIGSNTAILAVSKQVLLGDLPVTDDSRLVLIRSTVPQAPIANNNATVPEFVGWKERSRSFESMGAALGYTEDFGLGENGAPPERVSGYLVTADLFPTLRVQPLMGRVFTEQETELENPAPVVILSYGLWQRRFGADANILGKSIRVGGSARTVIGVMPQGFWFPFDGSQYWGPLAFNRAQLKGSARFFVVTARLKDGVTLKQAQAEMDSIGANYAQEEPGPDQNRAIRLDVLREAWWGWARQPLATFEVAVALVLLIACANVATLLLARGAARAPEIAMRVALGAGRGRILRQLLTESVLVSVLGGLLGVVIALAGVRALVTLHPAVGGVPISTVLLDWITLLWMTGISIAAGIAFGIVPALAALTPQNTVRGISRLASRHALRGVLVTAQVALSLVLLAGAALLLNSSIRLANQDRGIEPRGILAFNFRIPVEDYLRNRGSYRGLPVSEAKPPTLALQRVFERLRVIPGVESAAGQSIAPLNIAVLPRMAILPEGRPVADEDISRGAMDSVYFLATPGVFRTMKGTVRRGRDFSDQDTASTPWVAVINETAARRFWPGEDPIGKRFTVDAVSGERPREVVGVVRDIPLRYVEPFSQPVIYTSYLQQAEMFHGAFANMFGQMTFLLRTSGDPMSLAPAVRAAVAEIDPDHPLADMVAEDEFVGADVRQRFYRAGAIGLFAFVAVLLAAIGVYGVMAHSVEQRRGEIGIRMALGASVREVVALIGRRAFVLVITGVVLGLGGALALSRLLQAQLWGITATDPTTFVGVSLLLVATAAAACFAPARRAARVDPAVTLRSE